MLKHRPQSVSRRMVSSAMQTRRDATYGTRVRREVSARLCRQVRHPTDHLEALRVLHDSSARREYCSARQARAEQACSAHRSAPTRAAAWSPSSGSWKLHVSFYKTG